MISKCSLGYIITAACPLRTRAEARNGYGAGTVTHESTLLSTCPAPLLLPQKGQWQRGEKIYVIGALVRNAFRLGLGCKQPHLFQLNIIKVIKCLKSHAGFMSAWLWPRCICCESPLRMVGELGAVLSQSLKGVSLGGFVSSFCSHLSMGWKHCTKKMQQGRLMASWGPLWLWVASPSQWLRHPGIWVDLKVQVYCFGKQDRQWHCKVIWGFAVLLASMLQCTRFAQ